MKVIQFNRIKIVKTDLGFNEIINNFPAYVGEGSFRVVYSNENEKEVLKVPVEIIAEDFNSHIKLSEFNFFRNEKGKVQFHYLEDKNITDSMLDNIQEALIYENCEDDLVYLLCPIYSIIITKEGFPLSIAKKCEGDFEYFVENIFYNSNILDSIVGMEDYKEETIDNSIYNYMEFTGKNSVDILCDYFGKKETFIKKINKDLNEIFFKFNLDYNEQINNWGNLGFDTQGNIFMLDFN